MGERKDGKQKPIEIWVDDEITLKQMQSADVEALYSIIDRNREHLSRFGDETATNYPSLESYQLRLAVPSPDEYRFGIWDQDEAVGFIKLTKQAQGTAEIGYWLGEEFTGKGLMRKSADSLTKYAINSLGFNEVTARVVKENAASLKVLQSIGYEIIGDDPKDATQYLLSYRRKPREVAEGPEPFRQPLEHIQQGSIAELKKFINDDRYIVRVEPYKDYLDYPAFNQALLDFEQQSGLKVVPHRVVIGAAKYNESNEVIVEDLDEARNFKAVFHVTSRVDGLDAFDRGAPNNAIPPEEIAKLMEGIITYFSNAYENGLPNIPEIRPNQFMYGTVEGEPNHQFYMVDLDNALQDNTTADDIFGSITDCIEYLQEYPLNVVFIPIAQQMLRLMRDPGVSRWADEYEDRGEYVSRVELNILDYIDSLDHLEPKF